jgi:hypothetical protein
MLNYSSGRNTPLVDGHVGTFILTKRVDSVFLFCYMEITLSENAYYELKANKCYIKRDYSENEQPLY